MPTEDLLFSQSNPRCTRSDFQEEDSYSHHIDICWLTEGASEMMGAGDVLNRFVGLQGPSDVMH